MNGQPTAQNTRECGADGALPAFRNWDNPKHIEELAKLWNVHPDIIPLLSLSGRAIARSLMRQLIRASAAATTLLFALGGLKPTVHDGLTVMIGVLIIAVLGEGVRRFRLGQIK